MRVASIALLVAVGAIALVATRAGADIEGGTFSSPPDNVRMTLPRGWRTSDQATFPGVILRMFRTRPRAAILLAVDDLDAATSRIEASCKVRPTDPATTIPAGAAPPVEVQLACQQRRRVITLGFEAAPIKEAARPWFDYGDKQHQLRQGIAVIGGRVFTLVLSADTTASRAQYARIFDKALRSLRRLEAEEGPAIPDSAGGEEVEPTEDGGVPDAEPR